MEKSCAEQLTDVLEKITYEEMPTEIREKAKECLADFFGVFCGGAKKELSHRIGKMLRERGASSAEDIAMWMASSARTLDLDDGHRYAMAHPGVVINAAAAAVAVSLEERKISGKELIEAVVRGYEVYCYQGRLINPGAYLKRGIDATCACGAGAAAAVAASLYRFNKKQTADAVSLAASIAGGLNQSAIDGSAQKYLAAGYGAKIGISAANLARYGLGGPAHVFEGKLGFANAFCPEPDAAKIKPRLQWDIQYVYLKIYACVRRIHATLDAVKKIMEDHRLDFRDVEQVDVFGGPFLCDAGVYNPKDLAQAQTSIPYTVAVLLRYGRVTDELVEENIGKPEIAAIMKKVKVSPDAEITAMGERDKSLWGAARVKIRTVSGQQFTMKKIVSDGEKESPFPEEIIREKFRRSAGGVLNDGQADRVWQELMTISESGDVGEVFYRVLKQIEDSGQAAASKAGHGVTDQMEGQRC